jgi:putative spermidine/putrescine transport system substrate-binding protein
VAPTIDAGGFAGDLVVGVDYGGLLSWIEKNYVLDDPRIDQLAATRNIPQRYRHPGALIPNEYAYVMAASGKDTPVPATWSDFWDVQRYPGPRALFRTTPVGQLEAALLADGVSPDKLYPLDVDRAFKKLDKLRASTSVLYANSPADLVNLLARGDAKYAIAFSNRLEAAKNSGLPVSFTYADGLRTGNGFGLLKGARNVDAAVAFLDFATRPDVLFRFSRLAGLRRAASQSPQGATEIAIDPSYWATNRAAVGERWVRWLVH